MEALQLAHRSGRLERSAVARITLVRWSAYYVGAVTILLFGVLEPREFIYARF
jgi:hypothetical protein